MSTRVPAKPGDRFGRLTLLEDVGIRAHSKRYWKVVCDCGKVTEVRENNMKSGRAKSCGCFNSEMTSKRNWKYGLGATAESQAWRDMRKRCFNPKDPSYPNYGGRGIDIDPRWDDFMAFLADVGPKPRADYTLDRRDNSRGYWPDNVRWVPMVVQQRNKRTNCIVELHGRKMLAVEWAEFCGMDRSTFSHRLRRVREAKLPNEAVALPKGEFRRVLTAALKAAQPAVAS